MKKFNLQGVSEILSEKELKNVTGGSSGSDLCSSSYKRKSCKTQSDCGGQLCIKGSGGTKCCY